jgi:hypothetical protein
VTLAVPHRDRSVTLKCHALETPTIKEFKGVTLYRDTSSLLRGIGVSRLSVTLRQTVTLHRDTSIPLGGCEVSRQVWTSLVRPLAAALATTTPAFGGRRTTSQSGTVLTSPGGNKPTRGQFGGSAAASTE